MMELSLLAVYIGKLNYTERKVAWGLQKASSEILVYTNAL